MKRKLLLTLAFAFGASTLTIAQSKTTGDITLDGVPITANFTLNNTTSQVTLVLTGPSDRWFGIGIGVSEGFGMASGDALVFTTSTTPNLTDRRFSGTSAPNQDTNQDWTTVSNVVNGTTRTLTLTRALTNSDSNDFQFPYATTNSITIGGVRPSSATMNVGSHGNAGFVTGTFTTLGTDSFSLKDSQLFPNPSNGDFTIIAKTNLTKVDIYTITGAFVKSINVSNSDSEVSVSGLQTGVYLLELQNETEKSWKKVIVN